MVNLLVVSALLLTFVWATGIITWSVIGSVVTFSFAVALLVGVIVYFAGPTKGPL
jgi:hypothetical protein